MVRGRKKVTGVYATRAELVDAILSMRDINMGWDAIAKRVGVCNATCKRIYDERAVSAPKSDWRPGMPWTEAHRAKMKGKGGPKKGSKVIKPREKVVKDRTWTNVTLDPETTARLTRIADAMEEQFGFRPSVNQSIRYALTKAFG